MSENSFVGIENENYQLVHFISEYTFYKWFDGVIIGKKGLLNQRNDL